MDVGGGAWRVKWHPSADRKNDLLVACMHDGFKVIRVGADEASDTDNRGHVVKHYTAHQSLAYGADWSFADGGGSHTMIASCSFYDNALHLWYG
jgi:diphthamide biosynthesis protein 7